MSSACLRFTTRSGSGPGIKISSNVSNLHLSTTTLIISLGHPHQTRTRTLSTCTSTVTRSSSSRTLLTCRSRSHRDPPPRPPTATTSPLQTTSRTFTTTTMAPKASASIPSSNKASATGGALPIRPSSSVILLSPTNQVLLLHRVAKSSSFASAHVFPGGNLSEFHEGEYYPLPQGVELHRDSEAYRLAAVRETFEESGILLARRKGGSDGGLLELSEEELEEGRKEVFGDKVKFTSWLESKGGVADVGNLHPFTRWITPQNQRKRFTTQMYLYMLPLHTPTNTNTASSQTSQTQTQTVVQTPTHDGGIEHTAALFDSPSTWLAKASSGDIILYPPQFYLLTLISRFLPTNHLSNYSEQREKLLSFLHRVPTSSVKHFTSDIPWAEKVMSPEVVGFAATKKQGSYGNDGRVILGLAKPGRELMMDSSSSAEHPKRGGDMERVVLVDFRKEEVEQIKEEQQNPETGEVIKTVVKTAVRVPRDLEVVERVEAMAMAVDVDIAPTTKKGKGSKL
ncbi:hypothetical protein QBC32DRAFT_334960 [Pseudoneurospora amorphoporcata]|uniref:Nudix hydrolase domain-containing protein n=1 Tax=Pseudoneurospora amorphoporcata TaxID=241081 RepID=A0AAN6P3E3_9PEZI|nr:hypothetical protein QBC32DRAFT_334960 [Pseudoneurospora amorphoporcata]